MNVSLVGSSEDLIMIVTNSTSVVVDSLHPDYLYQCSVAARNSAGLGAAKTVLERTLPDGESGNVLYNCYKICLSLFFTVPSGPPMNVIGVALDSRFLHLSWSPPALDQQNGNIIKYGVHVMDLQDGSVRKLETPDLRTTLTVSDLSDLHPYYHYNYTVTAFTLVGEGPYTSPESIQMPQDGRF